MNRAPFNTPRLKLPLCFAQAPLSVFFFLWPPCDVLACVRICQVRPESSGLIDGKRIHCKRAQSCWLFFLFVFFQSGRCLRPSHLPRRCGAFTAAAFVAHIRRGRIPRAVIRVHLAAVSVLFFFPSLLLLHLLHLLFQCFSLPGVYIHKRVRLAIANRHRNPNAPWRLSKRSAFLSEACPPLKWRRTRAGHFYSFFFFFLAFLQSVAPRLWKWDRAF